MARRLLDVVLTGLALIVLAPAMALAAIGIRLSSPGPVLYRAVRAGRDGRPFVMYKMRTMHHRRRSDDSLITAEDDSLITAEKDPRVFPFGAWLRRAKLDELPQIFNVLRGEMAIVGPRPEDPTIVDQHYTAAQWETLKVAPGLTSPGALYSTTHGEQRLSAVDPERDYVQRVLPVKLALDRVYVRHASVGYDLALIFRTIAVVAGRALGRRLFRDPPEMREALQL